MGYSCTPEQPTDPLYKAWPFYITLVVDDKSGQVVCAYGMYYDSGARGSVDFGAEVSAFKGPYRSVRFDHGDLDYYIMFADDMAGVLDLFTQITGRPLMPPK